MLKRLALPSSFDECANSVKFIRGEDTLKIQIKLHARQLEHVREQEFRVEAGRIHTLASQKICALLNRFQHRHPRSLGADACVQS